MSNRGNWTIITGASSGIGRALAYEFASGGFNLLLSGRNDAALKEVSAQCHSRHGVETDVIVTDLSCPDSIQQLTTAIASKPYRYEVLVNNAGFGIHGEFAAS